MNINVLTLSSFLFLVFFFCSSVLWQLNQVKIPRSHCTRIKYHTLLLGTVLRIVHCLEQL